MSYFRSKNSTRGALEFCLIYKFPKPYKDIETLQIVTIGSNCEEHTSNF